MLVTLKKTKTFLGILSQDTIPNRGKDSISNMALEYLGMYKNDFLGSDEIGIRIWKTLDRTICYFIFQGLPIYTRSFLY
jgi:hypothetical protein